MAPMDRPNIGGNSLQLASRPRKKVIGFHTVMGRCSVHIVARSAYEALQEAPASSVAVWFNPPFYQLLLAYFVEGVLAEGVLVVMQAMKFPIADIHEIDIDLFATVLSVTTAARLVWCIVVGWQIRHFDEGDGMYSIPVRSRLFWEGPLRIWPMISILHAVILAFAEVTFVVANSGTFRADRILRSPFSMCWYVFFLLNAVVLVGHIVFYRRVVQGGQIPLMTLVRVLRDGPLEGRLQTLRSFDDEECRACGQDMGMGSAVWQLPCGHVFHKQCVEPGLHLDVRCSACSKAPLFLRMTSPSKRHRASRQPLGGDTDPVPQSSGGRTQETARAPRWIPLRGIGTM